MVALNSGRNWTRLRNVGFRTSTETGTSTVTIRIFQTVPNIEPSVLLWKSICTVIVGTSKVRSAYLNNTNLFLNLNEA